MNSCTFAGRVGQDAEVRSTSNGQTVANFSLAVDRFKKDQGPIWIRAAIWGERAEKLAPYILKGTSLAVTGEVDIRTYETKSGEQKSDLTLNVNRVTFLGGKAAQTEAAEPEITDEDIPF